MKCQSRLTPHIYKAQKRATCAQDVLQAELCLGDLSVVDSYDDHYYLLNCSRCDNPTLGNGEDIVDFLKRVGNEALTK